MAVTDLRSARAERLTLRAQAVGLSATAVWQMVRRAWWLWIWLAGSLTVSPGSTVLNALVAFGWMVLIHRCTEPWQDQQLQRPGRSALELAAGLAVGWAGLMVVLHSSVPRRVLDFLQPTLYRPTEVTSDPTALRSVHGPRNERDSIVVVLADPMRKLLTTPSSSSASTSPERRSRYSTPGTHRNHPLN